MSFSGLCIGLVGPLEPPAGGMALQTAQLRQLLRGAGGQVLVAQTNAPYRPAAVARIPMLRALFRLLPYLGRLWALAGRCDVLHLMANSGWSWHLHCAPAIWIAKLRGTPVVVNYRGGGAAAFMAGTAPLVKLSMRQAAGLIVPSGYLQQVFAQFGVKASIVPNIIDLHRYRPADWAPNAEAGSVHLVVTRNLETVYDNATAIRALALVRDRHPHARLTLAGSGPELARLRDLAAVLGLQDKVQFAGRLNRDAMASLYQGATVMINPSLTDNMPNSVLEALASGVPVVSTDVGGVPYLLQDGVTGLLVKPGRPDQMADAILRLLSAPELRASLVANGLREVQRYTWAQVAPLLQAVYRQSLSASRAKTA